jgi:hypothetical protein
MMVYTIGHTIGPPRVSHYTSAHTFTIISLVE